MCIEATIVAYAFSVQYFESTALVACMGLRVKQLTHDPCHEISRIVALMKHLFENKSSFVAMQY